MHPARVGALALALAALPACSPFSRQAQPPVSTYLLNASSAVVLSAEPGCHVLMVNSVGSAPGYETSRIIYMREPHKLEYFAFNAWADTPASMLHPLLVHAAEQSGLFSAVVTPTSPVQGDLRLDTQLVALEQHMENKSSHVELSVNARLFGRETLLGSRLFRIEQPAAANPVAGVDAANNAVKVLEGDLFKWIAEVITRTNPPCPMETNASFARGSAHVAREPVASSAFRRSFDKDSFRRP